jgi:hypothetical protein
MSAGRFSVSCTDRFAVLLDTATGRAWSCPLPAAGSERREWQAIRFAETGQILPPELAGAEQRAAPPPPPPARRPAAGMKVTPGMKPLEKG